MARCGCAGTCSCAIDDGVGTSVSGSGSAASPYTINNTGILVITSQAGTAYTIALTDVGDEVEFTAATAVTVTIPTNATTAFVIGSVINIRQMGAGQVTVSPAGGVTLRAPNGAKTALQYSTVTLIKRATNEWVISGDTTT